jgi:Spy/CpxP family protein refolding chaperone
MAATETISGTEPKFIIIPAPPGQARHTGGIGKIHSQSRQPTTPCMQGKVSIPMLRKSTFVAAIMTFALLLCTTASFAQPAQGGQGGQRGGRGNFDPAQALQFQLDNIKEQLAASDAEWTVLQPKVEKLLGAQQAAQAGQGRGGGRGGQRGGRGGQNGPGGQGGGRGGQNATSAAAIALNDLRTLLDNAAAAPEQIAQKLAALRDARAKAQSDLTAAQKDLSGVLTARQEAIMVTLGYLN